MQFKKNKFINFYLSVDSFFKYAAYVKEIVKGHLLGRNIPVLVTLCVTNRCNLRCTYCYEAYYDRNHREFTTEEILKLIDELYEMGTKYISINGGEPFLRKDIEIIIDKVNERNLLCHVSTNGLFLAKHLDAIRMVDSIAISIDGNREDNDINRGKGTYNKIIEVFELLKENNIKFHTSTILTKNNINAVEDILDLASQYGFKSQFSALRGEDSPNKDIILSDKELHEVFKKILVYKKQGRPIFFSSRAYENALDWPFTYNKQMAFNEILPNYNRMECYLKRFSCHIEANGFVYPCIVLINKYKALNFLEVGFEKAWKNLENCDCKVCYNICTNDLNRIFGFSPEVIWNSIKISLGRIVHEWKS